MPTESLLEGRRVLVLADGVLESRDVRTGIANWQFTEIVDGAAAGERVVLSVAREGVRDGAAAVPDETAKPATAER